MLVVTTMSPDPEQKKIDAYAAAALAAQGKTQTEIADAMELSQSAVSRLLQNTQALIQVETKFLWDKVEPHLHEKVRRRMFPHEVSDLLANWARQSDKHPPTVRIVPIDEVQDLGSQFAVFARHAAVVLRELLTDALGRVGVAWCAFR
jgi:DNA-binding transcriptional regulator LsrR (DeoR family)